MTAAFCGTFTLPGDKSLSHRVLMLSALSQETSRIQNFLYGHDCMATKNILSQLGIGFKQTKESLWVRGVGPYEFKESKHPLDCVNSGTTLRLLLGLLCTQKIPCEFTGLPSLLNRPMGRVIDPLNQMGAKIIEENSIFIKPSKETLSGGQFVLPMASAQVKSALLLAGLFTNSPVRVKEPYQSRDHTERLLAYCQKQNSFCLNIHIPGDPSSAAFLMALALIKPGSQIILKDILYNPTRNGFLDACIFMGGNIRVYNIRQTQPEWMCDIEVKYTPKLKACDFFGAHVVRMIDEIPILAVLATQAEGVTHIKDAKELKVKESNRLFAITKELSCMGANVRETADGLVIEGKTALFGTKLNPHGDHRMAMSLSVAAQIAQGESELLNPEIVEDSFPGFFRLILNANEV